MTPTRASLRLRLFGLILLPLILMAAALGYWRMTVAQHTTEDLFDRTLLSAALAISRDVAVSQGDALSSATRDLVQDAAGGEVFYHATGPGGYYVTGYAYPPAVAGIKTPKDRKPHYYLATYRGEPVRVLRLTERVTIGNLTGDTTVTVWQRLSDRAALTRTLAKRAGALMGALLAALAGGVWFGVELGLRPLTDLQQAIGARSPDDLSTIKRPVPVEVRGIVETINRLFGQVQRSIKAHRSFISDAAHQLRNPAAAVQSMAEAVRDAPNGKEREKRIIELIEAARRSAGIANQLLSLSRLDHASGQAGYVNFDLNHLTRDICTEEGPAVFAEGLDFELAECPDPLDIKGDPILAAEAIKNLIDNARKHGGEAMTQIVVTTMRKDGMASVTVADDGNDLSPQNAEAAFARFTQLDPFEGSGLGLAIVHSVAERHQGRVQIDRVEAGASVTLSFPLSSGRTKGRMTKVKASGATQGLE